jgi:hypothetical protein
MKSFQSVWVKIERVPRPPAHPKQVITAVVANNPRREDSHPHNRFEQ